MPAAAAGALVRRIHARRCAAPPPSQPPVGRYTQQAAYRFYGVMGAIIPIGTFFPGRGIAPWLIAWGIGRAIIVPWPIWAIVRIRREDWPDIELSAEPAVEESAHGH